MRGLTLPLRIAYTAVAAPLGWAVGFYPCMRFLPNFTTSHPQLDPNLDGSGIFNVAICVGAAAALTAALTALTLPWVRHRKIPGRSGRLAFSAVLVVLASLLFADLKFKLVYDLLFAAWLTYLLAFTYVRYGVIDLTRRSSSRSRRRSSRRY